MKKLIQNEFLIVYDGDCGFCNRTLMFLAKNDTNNYFRFVSNRSVFGVELFERYKIKGLEKSTIILIEKGHIYTKSTAIRRILLKIPMYRMIGLLIYFIPKKVSDWFYDFISNRRKRIVKNDYCEIPTSEIRKKFIM